MKNQLYYGDNLEILRNFVANESVDLCYIDPPFNSDENYNQTYSTKNNRDFAQSQAFIDTWTWGEAANVAFQEIVENKNQVYTAEVCALILGLRQVLKEGSLMAYLLAMTQRIAEIHRILKPTGSFYLHCDPTASHYLKLLCDALFCSKGRMGVFQNEIVWNYSGWNAKLKTSFNSRHDTILFYSKSPKSNFNSYTLPYHSEEEYVKLRRQKIHTDEEGKKYVLSDGGKGKRVKRYLEDAMQYGKPIDDVWQIDKLNNSSKERLGYPTQKPEALLERIIQTSSNEGDTVLDCFCGCGTTIAVAEKLNRKWIGIDITYQAISLILKRLEDSFGSNFTEDIVDQGKQIRMPAKVILQGEPQDFEAAVALANREDDRLRKEFEKWAVLKFSKNRAFVNDKKGGDGGIDGMAYMLDHEENHKEISRKILFSVKSNKSLNPSVIRDLFGTLEREQAAVGYLISLYPVENLVKEAAKYGFFENRFGQSFPRITVVSIQELLDGLRMNLPLPLDILKSAELKKRNNTENLF